MKLKSLVDKFFAKSAGIKAVNRFKFKGLFPIHDPAKVPLPDVSVSGSGTSSVPPPAEPAAAVIFQEDRLRTAAKTASDLQKVAVDFNKQADSAAKATTGQDDKSSLLNPVELDDAAQKADVHADSSFKHLFNLTSRAYNSQQKPANAIVGAEEETEKVLTEFEHMAEQKQHSGETAKEMAERFRKTLDHALEVCGKFREDEKIQSYNAEEIGSHVQRFSAGRPYMEIPADQMESESAALHGFSQAGLNAALRIRHGVLSAASLLREQTDLPNRMTMVINEMEIPSNMLPRVHAILSHIVELERGGSLEHLDEELKDVVGRAMVAGKRAKRAAVEQATLVKEELSAVEIIVKDSERLVSLWKQVNELIEANFGKNCALRIKDEVSGKLINIAHDVISLITTMHKADVALESVKTRYVNDVDPAVESFVQTILDVEELLRKQNLPDLKRRLVSGTESAKGNGKTAQGKQSGLPAVHRAAMDQIKQSGSVIAGINVQLADKNARIMETADPAKRSKVIVETRKLREDKAVHQDKILKFTAGLTGRKE